MWEIQCAWCRRMTERGGYPVGVPLSIRSAETHGICRECAGRLMAARAIHDESRGAIDREPPRYDRQTTLLVITDER